MRTIAIYHVNKTKEPWLAEAISLYRQRLRTTINLTYIPLKNDAQLLAAFHKEKTMLALDPQGKHLSSEGFAAELWRHFDTQGAHLAIAIGGPEGLPQEIRQKASLYSLSRLTFTHQIALLILTEQIYRAVEIHKGTPYHK